MSTALVRESARNSLLETMPGAVADALLAMPFSPSVSLYLGRPSV